MENFILEANIVSNLFPSTNFIDCLRSHQAPEVLNRPAFKDLLAYQRGSKHKVSDLMSPTTAIVNIKLCAQEIKEKLAKKLQVSCL